MKSKKGKAEEEDVQPAPLLSLGLGSYLEHLKFFYSAFCHCKLAILRPAASKMPNIACIAVLVLQVFATPSAEHQILKCSSSAVQEAGT